MNGRSVEDTAPVADMFNGKVEHYVYMSSAGIYKKSHIMPHHEVRLHCSFSACFSLIQSP
jgi:hypothetical protein